MAMRGKITESALCMLKNLPRVNIGNIKDLPLTKKPRFDRRRSRMKGKTHGRGHKGQGQRMTLSPLGYDGSYQAGYLKIPMEGYYSGKHMRRSYKPLSLLRLQRMIDTGRVDANEVIDLPELCNTGIYWIDTSLNHFGVALLADGEDIFDAQINIEVQHANELVIAAIERCGGTITTRYFDPVCLEALANPAKFFREGKPIPRCLLPPQGAMAYYTDPKNRGYLADPDEISKARLELAQKYGYTLPDLNNDPKFPLLSMRKDPKQIFFGLLPGSIVDLEDKCVLIPKSDYLQEYYDIQETEAGSQRLKNNNNRPFELAYKAKKQ